MAAESLRSSLVAVLGLTAALPAWSCSSRDAATQRATLSNIQRTTFLHAGFAPGPAVFTDDAGHLVEERRFEPFGAPIDAYRRTDTGDVVGAPDLVARDLNMLNKRVEVATGWSDHGARWMAPETGRWLSPDPPVTGPDAGFMTAPWALHPYQYVDQNPVAYWDPDGRSPAINQVAPTPPPPRSQAERFGSVLQRLQGAGHPDLLRASYVLQHGWDIVAGSPTSPRPPGRGSYDVSIVGNTKEAVDQILKLAGDAPIHRLLIADHGSSGIQTFGPDWLVDVYAFPNPTIDPDLLRLAGKFAPDGVLVLLACNFMDADNDGERQRLISGLQYVSSKLGVEVRAGENAHQAGLDTLHSSVTACRGDQCVTGIGEGTRASDSLEGVEAKWKERAQDGH